MKHVASRGGRTKSALWTILGILAELMLTAAAICALYIMADVVDGRAVGA